MELLFSAVQCRRVHFIRPSQMDVYYDKQQAPRLATIEPFQDRESLRHAKLLHCGCSSRKTLNTGTSSTLVRQSA
jgi:hypothetical protein